MEDQDGNAIYLPPSENKAVIKALAFFEKGKAALKRQNYEEALVILLEADQQFSTCQSKILESVDNYAYLNIDIVWCYLCLKVRWSFFLHIKIKYILLERFTSTWREKKARSYRENPEKDLRGEYDKSYALERQRS